MRKRISSRQFNQDTGGAKKAAQFGPVYITHHGKPAHVLMNFDDYTDLIAKGGSIVDLLSAPAGVGQIEFEIPISREVPRHAHFE